MAKSREVGIGLVGMGFMGLTHLRAARGVRGGRVVAIATRDPRKAKGDFSRVRGNFGEGGGREDLTGIRVVPDLDALIEDPEVDLIDICLPSYLHAPAAVRALRAGKSVLVEKPIALKPRDARRMVDASRKSGAQLFVAQVLRFFPEFALVRRGIETARWGALKALHLRRLIAKPAWGEDSWFADPERSGGMVVDLHIHDTDFIVHLFGRPDAVSSSGIVEDGEVQFLRTIYHTAGEGPLLSAEGGWINAGSLPFEHGYDAFFERATIHFNSSHSPRPVIYGARRSEEVELKAEDPFRLEIQSAVDSLRKGKVDPLLDPATAIEALEVCLAEKKSAVRKRTVRLKPAS